ncbi:GNAT family N-acetyltransferase [Roseateles sp.]|uniref:GNAT family N-acetyltransferase n=1 Tax=Roseateles sp. TaxID=1971397 RepID=UPI0025EA7F46|nr:GNAT family N-acetyltransferase [Roseateles sp.]MBV8034914.1 GNAT family N-acetyltransferase [Roseateles sp.]
MTVLITPRLRLEPLNDCHVDGLYRLNSDPVVMRYITGRPETLDDTRQMVARVKGRWAEFGYSWWAFQRLDDDEVIGMGCIQHLNRDPAGPLETGWRLSQSAWGQGYASEAARHMVGWAFATLKPELICAICQPENTASSTVMQRLGMTYSGTGRWYDMDCARYDVTATQWAASPARKAYEAEA